MLDNPQGREWPSLTQLGVPGQLGRPQIRYYKLDSRQLRRIQLRRTGSARRPITIGLLVVLALSLLVGQVTRNLMTPLVRQTAVATPLPSQHVQPASATPLPSPSPQPTPTPTLTEQAARLASQADQLLTNKAAQQQFSGSVLLAQDGQVLLSKGYSMADWDKQVPNTPHTKFYIGSITKQFTAMAILILQEQGKLQVHDPLCSYIAPCPAGWQAVTIQHLLTHTSGIAQLDDSGLSNASPAAWMASFAGTPLVSTPGGQFSYCSVCYQILAYVVEQVSGEPYSTFLQQAIFDPLQMKDTGFDPGYLSLPDHAVGYASWQVKDIDVGEDMAPQWSFLFGAGLLYSTAEDLYRWDQALYGCTLVSQQILNEAFTPYLTSQDPATSYGYGWFVAQAPAPGHRLVWHDGQLSGFRAYIGRYIDDGVTIIILSNLSRLDELALAQTLQQLVFAHPVTSTSPPQSWYGCTERRGAQGKAS